MMENMPSAPPPFLRQGLAIYVAFAGLELPLWTRMAWNSEITPCAVMSHHAQYKSL